MYWLCVRTVPHTHISAKRIVLPYLLRYRKVFRFVRIHCYDKIKKKKNYRAVAAADCDWLLLQ